MRELITKELLSKAILYGINYSDFWNMTLRTINVYASAYEERQRNELKAENLIAYIQGIYMCNALNSTVGNMFNKGKKIKYPEEPFGFFDTEEETIDRQRSLFLAELRTAQANFELSKGE